MGDNVKHNLRSFFKLLTLAYIVIFVVIGLPIDILKIALCCISTYIKVIVNKRVLSLSGE